MAYNFSGGSTYEARGTGGVALPASSQALTICGWAKAPANSWRPTFVISGTSGSGNYIQYGYEGTPAIGVQGNGIVDTNFSGTNPTTNWFFWAVICSGSDTVGYLYELGTDTVFRTVSCGLNGSWAPDIVIIGNSGGGDNWNGSLADIKIWNAILTANELYTEMLTQFPRRLADLVAFRPFFRDTNNYTGVGGALTITGSPTIADGPPVGWGGYPIWENPIVQAAAPLYDHDGTKPWASIWRGVRY